MVHTKSVAYLVMAVFLGSVLSGCVTKETTPSATPAPTTPVVKATPVVTPLITEIEGLAPDGKVIYNYIKNDSNYKKWKIWPGKSEMYPANGTHGAAFLTTYVNDIALSAIKGKTGKMHEDSVIVKENYGPDRKLLALTIMYKEDGYNPEHNDWFWAKYAPDGTIQAEGKVKACIDCHGMKKDNDYIFSGPLK